MFSAGTAQSVTEKCYGGFSLPARVWQGRGVGGETEREREGKSRQVHKCGKM